MQYIGLAKSNKTALLHFEANVCGQTEIKQVGYIKQAESQDLFMDAYQAIHFKICIPYILRAISVYHQE